jgi:transposase
MDGMYIGLDVSDKVTHICCVDYSGKVIWRGEATTDPEALTAKLKKHCKDITRIILETGSMSSFLYRGLQEHGLPATCVCARHAKKVLSVQTNKSDVHDAEGLANLARTGWFKAVHIKDTQTHLHRARLKIREQLVKAHGAMRNQMRGLLKLFGLRLGVVNTPNKRNERLLMLFAQKPELAEIMRPLMDGLAALEVQIKAATHELAKRAASDPVCERLMSVPGGWANHCSDLHQ